MAASARVSVMIPVYRRQRDLTFALQSLTSEAHLIRDVVVVDDASPEPIRIEPPAAIANRTRLIRLPENRGSATARQVGASNTTGDLIAFLDSDDAWLPGKLASQTPYFSTPSAMLAIATGWQEVSLEKTLSSARIPIGSADPVDFASGCWFCPGSTVMVTRAVVERCGPFDSRLRRLEDLDWFLRFALLRGRLEVAQAVGAVIRRSIRTDWRAVQAATRLISRTYATHPGATTRVRRHLAAWLDVETGGCGLDPEASRRGRGADATVPHAGSPPFAATAAMVADDSGKLARQ